MNDALREANIIFLDPDNGVGSTKRHATVAEVAAMRQPGRGVVLIKFPGRTSHDRQIDEYHSLLRTETGALSLVTVTTCVSVGLANKGGVPQWVPRIRWFTIVDPDDALTERPKQFAQQLNEIEKCKADVFRSLFVMEFRIADTFTDSLARLTGEEQKAVKTAAFDLQMNRAQPSLRLHRVDKSKDPNFWSASVNLDLRLIVHRTESSLLLCYVHHHEEAYDWARRRKLETHPNTGAAQLVELRETVQEIAI